MIKFFRLSNHNFVKQNRMSSGHLDEIAACGHHAVNFEYYDKFF